MPTPAYPEGMRDFLPLLVIFGALILALCGLAWLAVSARRRGTGGAALRGALAAWEEAYRVTSHDSYQEIVAEAQRKAPLLAPDEHWRPSGVLTRELGESAGGGGELADRRSRRIRKRRRSWLRRREAGRGNEKTASPGYHDGHMVR